MPTSRPLPLLRPDRLRRIPRSFAWIDHALRSEGFLQDLAPESIGLYLFLALAADAQGRSCWRLDQVERAMPCFDLAALDQARRELVQTDLVAYRPWSVHAVEGSYQLLALPPRPVDRRPSLSWTRDAEPGARMHRAPDRRSGT